MRCASAGCAAARRQRHEVLALSAIVDVGQVRRGGWPGRIAELFGGTSQKFRHGLTPGNDPLHARTAGAGTQGQGRATERPPMLCPRTVSVAGATLAVAGEMTMAPGGRPAGYC